MKKSDLKKLTHYICFNCATIFPIVDDEAMTCTECGYIIEPDLYDKIINYAFEAVYYGHDYREKYEEQINDRGEITERYCLHEPSTILCFLAIAALSGVVGNLSTELVKKAFKTILNKVKNCKEDIGQNKVSFLKDAEIDVYIQQVNVFHNDFQGIDPSVKAEITKEIFIHELIDSLLPEMKKKNMEITEKMIFEIVKQTFDRVKTRQKLSKQDFENFWKAIGK